MGTTPLASLLVCLGLLFAPFERSHARGENAAAFWRSSCATPMSANAPAQLPPPRPPVTPNTAPAQSRPATETIVIAGEHFALEVAATVAARNKGLMGRTDIESDGGMLFIYPRPELLGFWMAGCVIDIDIVFLDARGRIVATHTMKPEPARRAHETERDYHDRLPLYSSRRPAQFAIELRSGSIERLKLQRGHMIKLDVHRLAALAR